MRGLPLPGLRLREPMGNQVGRYAYPIAQMYFLIEQYIKIPKKKIGHSQKGTTFEPLGIELPEGRLRVGQPLSGPTGKSLKKGRFRAGIRCAPNPWSSLSRGPRQAPKIGRVSAAGLCYS